MSTDNLRFPSGRTVRKIKQDAKKSKNQFNNYTESLNAAAKTNGLDMPWDKAVPYLAEYWDKWFAVDIYQEDAPWQIDVRHAQFTTKEEAETYGKTFSGSLKWIGGDQPLIHINDRTGDTTYLNNSDVRLWRVKKECEDKISISMHDMERLHAPFRQWCELFGNDKPRFESIAYGAEYGDDDGTDKGTGQSSVPTADVEAFIGLERIGIKFRAEQSEANIYQIVHSYDTESTFYYLLTKAEKHEIESLIAALHLLVEEDEHFPSYYSGGNALTGSFVASVIKECFEQTIITAEHFNFNALSNDAQEIDVEVINIFHIEDGFDKSQYDVAPYTKAYSTIYLNRIIPLFRLSMGLPEDLEEHKWKLVNINPNAINRNEIPLEVTDVKVKQAWMKRFDLEELIFHSFGTDLGLSRDDDFSEIHGFYQSYEEDAHTYPIYRVQHEDFVFNAT
ncbi:hypothetical protein [Moritella sp. F3]|uniref:hypothetical protein n=1 Tax=Moritella sp. F3 TaxID=2718882 RepID=UPI0018E1B37F|nr:hypothetical protein [Moritella sp. F3]GIC77673.1 hypothetical protein FMO001_24000 [Moritella sp. F1]GIC82086.1 hypothetical protein FMO003_23670 [Moritella sp. F3]